MLCGAVINAALMRSSLPSDAVIAHAVDAVITMIETPQRTDPPAIGDEPDT